MSASPSGPPGEAIGAGDAALVEALQRGDEAVFRDLVERWGGVMLRVALVHVTSFAVAEEVVQEAWLIVLRDLDRFERRSAFRTWVLGIVANVARTRARAERRAVPVAIDAGEDAVDPSRFRSPDAAQWPDHWAVGPTPWAVPEDELLAGEARAVILTAIAALPPAQREVLVLRDLAGGSAEDACNVFGLSDTNQRVLLHRARARVRGALEEYFHATEPT
jgi:RNA polymerase sigma-70 factor, ECF subfamily